MKSIEAGKLNQRITLCRFVRDPGALNQFDKGHYDPAFSVWADVKISQSSVQTDGGVMVWETVAKFYIRKRDGILPNMHILWKEREFALTGPPIDWKETAGGITLQAREVT